MSLKKPILAFDFDDVLVDVTRGFLSFYKNKQGLEADYENIETDLSPLLRINEEEELKLWDRFFESEEYLSITPTTEQLETLAKIKQRFDLIIVTNRVERFRESAIKWIEKHLPDYFSKVVFATDFPEDRQSKGSICAELKATFLIDDEPKNILSCLDHNIPVIIYDCPWNRKLEKNIPRIKSFEEIGKFISPFQTTNQTK